MLCEQADKKADAEKQRDYCPLGDTFVIIVFQVDGEVSDAGEDGKHEKEGCVILN
jgi:hypothetical protein